MRKWQKKPRVIVHETSDVHERLKPFIASEIDKKQWPYQVIEGESEAESVIERSDEFLVLPDVESCDDIHWLALFSDTNLKSIRSLRGHHIPLLQRAVQSVERLQTERPVMMYFHYPPSVWQLHMHVVSPCEGLRTTNDMQRVHFVTDVIRNLEIDPEYYTKATLTFVLPVFHDLVLAVHNRN